MTIFRSLVDRVPSLLLAVVLGWSCVLFFGYGLLSDVDALTIVLAALGAICVASAVLLILELSDPYSGLFRMPHERFDGTRSGPDKRRRDGGRRRDVGSKLGARVGQRFIVGYERRVAKGVGRATRPCPRATVVARQALDLGGPRLPGPYHFRARNQSFQPFATPFPGDSQWLCRSARRACFCAARPEGLGRNDHRRALRRRAFGGAISLAII